MNYFVNEIACITKLRKEIGIFIERKLCIIADFFQGLSSIVPFILDRECPFQQFPRVSFLHVLRTFACDYNGFYRSWFWLKILKNNLIEIMVNELN